MMPSDNLAKRIAILGSAPTGQFPPNLPGVVTLISDVGTLQTSGGAAANADSQPVGEWQDQSGNLRHAGQVTAGKRPTLKLGAVNGLPAISFDGVDDFLKTAAFTLNQPCTIVGVLKYRSILLVNAAWVDGNAAFSSMGYTSNGGGPHIYAGTVLNLTGVIETTSFHVWTCLFNGVSSQVYLDGASLGIGDAGAANAGAITVGNAGDGSNPGPVDVAELRVFSSVLLPADVAAVNAYLRTRYGI